MKYAITLRQFWSKQGIYRLLTNFWHEIKFFLIFSHFGQILAENVVFRGDLEVKVMNFEILHQFWLNQETHEVLTMSSWRGNRFFLIISRSHQFSAISCYFAIAGGNFEVKSVEWWKIQWKCIDSDSFKATKNSWRVVDEIM